MNELRHQDGPAVMMISLGCAKNEVDAEIALGDLAEEGFNIALSVQEADIVLINTCGFIADARAEAREVIEGVLAAKKNGVPKIGVMGCMAQRYGAQIRKDYPDVDGVFGLGVYGSVSKVCRSLLKGKKLVEGMSKNREVADGSRLLSTPPSFAYLRIADGCNNYCSYCAIPLIRGKCQSRRMERIIEEATVLENNGIAEQVIIAQDTTLYGEDFYGEKSLSMLLKNLLGNTTKSRFRLMYMHPAHLTEDIVKMVGQEERICSYLDLPLQHVNSGILEKMNRKYDRKRIDEVLGWFAKHAPQAALRTSLIAGFPTETEQEFEELLAFVREGHFHYMGAFPYSCEEGTAALKLGDNIAAEVKQERTDLLMQEQQKVTFDWLESRIGSRQEVVVEEITSEGEYICRSELEAPDVDGMIYFKPDESAESVYNPGDRVSVSIVGRYDYDLFAEIIPE